MNLHRTSESKRRCPFCGSHEVVPILYGLPGPEMMEQAEAGKIALGGCCVTGDDPNWHCNKCGHEWGRPKEREE